MLEFKKISKQYKPKGVSNSSLSWFEISPKYYKERSEGNIDIPDKDYFDIGTKVHYYLLQPDLFKQLYVYLEYDTPKGDKQKKFCVDYVNLKHKAKKNDEDAAIRSYEKNYVVKAKSKDKIKEEALDLYKSLRKYLHYLEAANEYKDILNYTTVKYLEEIKKQVSNHKLANELLGNDLIASDYEEYNEFNIEWYHPIMKDVMCSSTLDRLVIDHNKKEIKIIDLKTTSKLSKFEESFKSFKYYRQVAYYWMAVEYYFKSTYSDKNFDEYDKKTYIIAFQTNNNTNTSNLLTECEVFNIGQEWLIKGKKETEDLFTKLIWHYDNNLWEHTREYYEGSGSIKLQELTHED